MEFLKDDRNIDNERTHTILVGGKDTVLSHWACNNRRASYAFWACQPADADIVLDWVRSRSDIKCARIRESAAAKRLAKTNDVHIYVVGSSHPALNRLND
jgi:hypothetical protein